MTYTGIGVVAVVLVSVADVWVLRTRLLGRRAFWAAYVIIAFFQLLTNGLFTGFGIVRYDGDAILGGSSPSEGATPFLGDGRIAFAPVEDLLFGFALALLTLSLWVYWGRRGIGRTPAAGPPVWRSAAPRQVDASTRDGSAGPSGSPDTP